MIRIVIGLIMIMGSAGGIEMDTATMTQALLLAIAGLCIMLWPILDGTVKE